MLPWRPSCPNRVFEQDAVSHCPCVPASSDKIPLDTSLVAVATCPDVRIADGVEGLLSDQTNGCWSDILENRSGSVCCVLNGCGYYISSVS